VALQKSRRKPPRVVEVTFLQALCSPLCPASSKTLRASNDDVDEMMIICDIVDDEQDNGEVSFVCSSHITTDIPP